MYDHLLPDGMVDRQTVEIAHQIVPVDTYLDELGQARLTVTGIYGDFDRSAFTADSPQLIFLATL
jgi:hypothetical protein